MSIFEKILGHQPMKGAENEKSFGGSESSHSRKPEEEKITFTDEPEGSREEPAVSDAVPHDSHLVSEAEMEESKESFAQEFSIVTEELDRWSESLKKEDDIALYDRLYERMEAISTTWNELNNQSSEQGEEKDRLFENLRLLEVFEDLRLIEKAMPMSVQEAIMKAQGVFIAEEELNPNLKTERTDDHMRAEANEDTAWRGELDAFLSRPEGRETIGMLGDMITAEWQAFDQKIFEEARTERGFISRSERSKLWRTFFLPQMKEMAVEYLEGHQSVPRGDGNKIFRAIIRNLEESAAEKIQ